MKIGHWRRWRPERMAQGAVQVAPERREWDGDVWERVERRVRSVSPGRRLLRKQDGVEWLDPIIQSAKDHAYRLDSTHAENDERAEAWLYALVLQSPRAAIAQEAMDKHPHGYHNKEKRLYELIDFNDAFVSAVLAMPEDELPEFNERTKQLCDQMCKKAGVRCFSNEQFQAIAHGLSREIAVYRGLQREGFEAEMTNRTSDAFGIDMRVVDPKTFKSVNIDIKTRSAYHFRVSTLHREGRLSEETAYMAERNGFTRVYNGHGETKVPVVVWQIDHEELGDIDAFSFRDTKCLGAMATEIFLRYGERA